MAFDIHAYRIYENLGKSLLQHWRIGQRHNLDVFERQGFPVRINMLQQVRQLIDTMQEGRFNEYMDELEGLDERELQIFLKACEEAIRFQLMHFHHLPVILPLDTLLSAFAVFLKIIALKPKFKSILEIGPGCGYLSFFLKDYKYLKNYSQIEACESFYMLQHLHNQFLFAESFEQKAYICDNIITYPFTNLEVSNHHSDTATLVIRPERKCFQYPWWKLGEIYNQKNFFDLVVSNANLLEFSPGALNDYLTTIQKVLKDDGLFVVQCFGWGAHPHSIDDLWIKLAKFAFKPIFLTDKLFIHVDRLLETLPPTTNSILIAPAGNAARLLIQNRYFTDRFPNITLIDNIKAGTLISGVPVLAPNSIENGDSQIALIAHSDQKLIRLFKDIFSVKGIPIISKETHPEIFKSFAVGNGVFMKNVMNEPIKLNNFFKNAWDNSYNIECINNSFFREKRNKKKFTKSQFIQLVKNNYNYGK